MAFVTDAGTKLQHPNASLASLGSISPIGVWELMQCSNPVVLLPVAGQ